MVIRIPQALVSWLPLFLFIVEVILVLTLGPKLIAAARRRRNRPPISLGERISRCFGASILAILAWMGMLYTTAAIIFASLGDKHHHTLTVALFCIALALISFLTFLIPGRICAGPIEDIKSAPRRRRYFITPGLLILICIWIFWAVFLPWMNFARNTACIAVNKTHLKGLGTAIELYAQTENGYPDRLGRLVDEGYASAHSFDIYGDNRYVDAADPIEGQPYRVPKEFHYIRLSDNTPGSMVCIWLDPTIFEGKPVPVLYRAGHVSSVPPEVLCAELFESYQWLLAPDNDKPVLQEQEWDHSNNDFYLLRGYNFLMWIFLGLFFIGIAAVLLIGSLQICHLCRKHHIPSPSKSKQVKTCLSAGIFSTMLLLACIMFCGLIIGPIVSLFVKWGFKPEIPALLIGCPLAIVAFVWGLRYSAKQFLPDDVREKTGKKGLYTPAVLGFINLFFFILFLQQMQQSGLRLAVMTVENGNLHHIGNYLNEYAKEHGQYPAEISDFVQKNKDSLSLFYFPRVDIDANEFENNPELLPQKIRYSSLPADAPGELLWVWPEPALYHGEQSPVLLKSGDVQTLWPDEIAERIGRTYEWLLEHRGEKAAASLPASAPSKKK